MLRSKKSGRWIRIGLSRSQRIILDHRWNSPLYLLSTIGIAQATEFRDLVTKVHGRSIPRLRVTILLLAVGYRVARHCVSVDQ